MKKFVLSAILLLAGLTAVTIVAQEDPDGNPGQGQIDLSVLNPPKPSMPVIEPTATFNRTTRMLTVTTDPTRYYNYVISVDDGHHSEEHSVTSSVFNVSLSNMTGHTAILIDSEDNGTYAGMVNVDSGTGTE
ncbi:MAG: hypothetical protein IKR25_01470 [Muribaculaceae bacterium]|nr:hypothetical protein [Muribaculaceae bacterium]